MQVLRGKAMIEDVSPFVMKHPPFSDVWKCMQVQLLTASGGTETSFVDQLLFRRDFVPMQRLGAFHLYRGQCPDPYSAYVRAIRASFMVLMGAVAEDVNALYDSHTHIVTKSQCAHQVDNQCLTLYRLPSADSLTDASVVSITCHAAADFAIAAYVTGASIHVVDTMLMSSPTGMYIAFICRLVNHGYPPRTEDSPPARQAWYNDLSIMVTQAVYTLSCRHSLWLHMAAAHDPSAYELYIGRAEILRLDVSADCAHLMRDVYPHPPYGIDDYRHVIGFWPDFRKAMFRDRNGFGLLPDPILLETDPIPDVVGLVGRRRARPSDDDDGGDDDDECDMDMGTGQWECVKFVPDVCMDVTDDEQGATTEGGQGATTEGRKEEGYRLDQYSGPLKKCRVDAGGYFSDVPAVSETASVDSMRAVERHREEQIAAAKTVASNFMAFMTNGGFGV